MKLAHFGIPFGGNIIFSVSLMRECFMIRSLIVVYATDGDALTFMCVYTRDYDCIHLNL